jgi:xanthine dehydrogenase YagT iron-sulfur-binding subunit
MSGTHREGAPDGPAKAPSTTAGGATRREFLTGVTTALAGAAAAGCGLSAQSSTKRSPLVKRVLGPGKVPITLSINGRVRTVEAEPRATLLHVLRDELDLTGTKSVCELGECGACTVLVDGTARYSCLTLALQAQGRKITTIEGLAAGGDLHPIQAAFVEKDGLQCGFCTPGQVMAAHALLSESPDPTPEEIRAGMAGNTCRCGAYPKIFEAIAEAAARMKRRV